MFIVLADFSPINNAAIQRGPGFLFDGGEIDVERHRPMITVEPIEGSAAVADAHV